MRDLVIAVTTHVVVWLVPLLAVVALVSGLNSLTRVMIAVLTSYITAYLGWRAARRVASWRVQARLVRALRREL